MLHPVTDQSVCEMEIFFPWFLPQKDMQEGYLLLSKEELVVRVPFERH